MKTKRVMVYFGHVIWMNCDGYFCFAKGDGTDYMFLTVEDAMCKIEEIENIN